MRQCSSAGVLARSDGAWKMILRPNTVWLLKPLLLFVVLAALCLVSCHQPENRTFSVRGVVQEIKPGGQAAVIRHDAIPGYMEAMTMPFDVKTTNELANVRPGDEIEFQLVVTRDDSWIERLKKTGRTMALAVSNAAPVVTTNASVRSITTRLRDTGIESTVANLPSASSDDHVCTCITANTERISISVVSQIAPTTES